MDYNNFIKRLSTSIVMLSFFLFILIFYSNYIKYLILIIFVVILFEILIYFKKSRIISIIYIFFSFFSIQYYLLFNFDKFIFFFFIISLIIFDTFSYIIGVNYGKKKLIPSISPNKTIVGLLGGLIFSILIVNLIYYFFNYNLSLNFFFFIIINLILGFIGDMIESLLKRRSIIKDSGSLLPGHGGFFDRFDSFILSSYILPFVNLII